MAALGIGMARLEGRAQVQPRAKRGKRWRGFAAAMSLWLATACATFDLDHPRPESRAFDVRPDVDLERRSVGERVVFQMSQEVSIDVWTE